MLGVGINLWSNTKDPYGLSLDLQFAADKTLTARKGPTPTFTRSTIATYFGPNEVNANFLFDSIRFSVNLSQTTLLNGRYRWENGDTGLSYNGTAWSLGFDGNNVATSAPTTAWRPDQADWGSGQYDAVITLTNNFGIVNAAIDEPRFEYDPVTFECLGLLAEEASSNYVFPSTTLGTQTRTTTAVAHTLSFYGTGTVALSGTHAASITGTSSTVRRIYTFTPTAGSLTLTVTGSVTLAQLERQSAASSYIRTTSAIGNRADDNFIYNSISDFYNDSAGTIFCESILKRSSYLWTALFGVDQNGIRMIDYSESGSLAGVITSDESTQFNSSMGVAPYGALRKSAMAFQNAGSAILCQNGTLGTQDNSIALPSDTTGGATPTILSLFRGQNSIIKSFRYYKKRLPNANLQTLTGDGAAAAYIAAITAAGATVSAPQQAAISTFMSAEIAAGRWDGIKRLYFPVWGLAAANALCMKSLTSGTFTGGAVTHAAGFVVSTRDGGFMNTNTTLGSLGINTSSYHFAVILKTSPFGGDNYSDCAYGISNMYPDADDGSDVYHIPKSVGNVIPAENVYKAGVFTVGGNQSSRYLKNRNSSALVTILDNELFTENFTNHNVFFMRANGAERQNQSSSTEMGAFSIATALTDAQDTAYTAALKTLWETTTGLTLP